MPKFTNAKFYVCCGCHQWVVSTDSAESAAMQLIDQLLATHAWIYDDPQLSPQQRRDHLVLESLLHLASEVQVSQRGFGRSDAGRFGVADLLDRWDRLMTAVSRLFVAAGMAPRRALPTAPTTGGAPRLPR